MRRETTNGDTSLKPALPHASLGFEDRDPGSTTLRGTVADSLQSFKRYPSQPLIASNIFYLDRGLLEQRWALRRALGLLAARKLI